MTVDGTLSQVNALLQANRITDAARYLASAAEAGEPAALLELANWRVAGNILRRDLAAARDLLRQAALQGSDAAALLHSAFLASGVGGADNWGAALSELKILAQRSPAAATQLRLLNSMELLPNGNPGRAITRRELSESPSVAVAEGFLTEAECVHLKQSGEDALQPSLVVDPSSGRMVPHPIRTSDGATIGVYAEDLVVSAINRRVAALSGTSLAQGEALQLLRYRAGHEYRAHLDALPNEPNQRVFTVLLYLSDGYVGGETFFPHINVKFRGKLGDALLFQNTTADGRVDPRSLHAGLPVVSGIKTMATRWIRMKPFIYPSPPSLLA